MKHLQLFAFTLLGIGIGVVATRLETVTVHASGGTQSVVRHMSLSRPLCVFNGEGYSQGAIVQEGDHKIDCRATTVEWMFVQAK